MVTPATLLPFCEISVEQVFQMITCNEDLRLLTGQVRNAPDMRTAKATLLPYVTPCGTFTRRNSQCFLSPSRLIVIDVDHLDSYEEAAGMRRTLFDDPFLRPVLTYISPSGRGVKAFVPTGTSFPADEIRNITESIHRAMQYVEMAYTPTTDITARATAKGVDGSGKDLARACFLSHDPEALFRNI
ncbi:BT4734/BF3469 family protein [Bacteroides acidifaciens]